MAFERAPISKNPDRILEGQKPHPSFRASVGEGLHRITKKSEWTTCIRREFNALRNWWRA